MSHQPVFSEPLAVGERLAELGLTVEALRDAVLAGESARNGCTPNDPPIAPGFVAWQLATRTLREFLAPDGWTRSDAGINTVVHPDGEVAIVVGAGDDRTGLPHANPRTRYARGPATVDAIERNIQPGLFDHLLPKNASDRRKTYVLLICRVNEEVRSELSLPAAVGNDGRVECWFERILLDPISLGTQIDPDSDDAPEPPPIEVSIRRR